MSLASVRLFDRGYTGVQRSRARERIVAFLDRFEEHRLVEPLESSEDLAEVLGKLDRDALVMLARRATALAHDDRLDDAHQLAAALLAGTAVRMLMGDDVLDSLRALTPHFEAGAVGGHAAASQTGRPEPDPNDRAAAASTSFLGGGGHGQRQEER